MKRTFAYFQPTFLLALGCLVTSGVTVAQTENTTPSSQRVLTKQALTQQVLTQQVLTLLRDPDRFRCLDTLHSMAAKNPVATRTALLNALNGTDKPARLRASWVLVLLPFKTSPPVVQALAAHLQTDPDPHLRLCCAIGLMSNKTPQAVNAYIRAANDKSEKVASLACGQLGFSGGTKGIPTLFKALSNPSWNVRLAACKALITLKAADARVVSTLEQMAHEPDAKNYDANIERFQKIDQEMSLKYPHDADLKEMKLQSWGKLDTILGQARQVAAHKR